LQGSLNCPSIFHHRLWNKKSVYELLHGLFGQQVGQKNSLAAAGVIAVPVPFILMLAPELIHSGQ
jgi:hypothetical protein